MKTMKCVTEKFQRLIAQMWKLGVCVDFEVFVDDPERDETDYIHEAFQLIEAKAQARQKEWGVSVENFYRITPYDAPLTGSPTTWEAFVGTEDASPEETSPTSCVLPPIDGFKTAFIYPPYGYRYSEMTELYEKFVPEVIGEREDVEIRQWSTDWSSYFDAGHEWWGAFLWTLKNRRRKEVIVIALSTTD